MWKTPNISRQLHKWGWSYIRARSKNRIVCRSISPAEAIQVSAGLFYVDFYGISQNPLVFCKKCTSSCKSPFFQYFPNLSDTFQPPGFEESRSFPLTYVIRGTLVSNSSCQGTSYGIWERVSPRCRSPPLLKFWLFSKFQKKRRTAKWQRSI